MMEVLKFMAQNKTIIKNRNKTCFFDSDQFRSTCFVGVYYLKNENQRK